MLTSQCVKVGSNITLRCPVEEELSEGVNWVPNEIIYDHNDYEYGDFSASLKVTSPSSILSDENGVVWCDYGRYYHILCNHFNKWYVQFINLK